MNRIDEAFKISGKERRHALIIYLTAGYPDLDTTGELVLELARRGVDIIELGVPFSDPIADGPTIQETSQKALERGATPSKILKTVSCLRERTRVPLVLMTYYNPVYSYGTEVFFRDAAECGADGLIIPDLPPEESSEPRAFARRNGLALPFLLGSNTTLERMKTVTALSSGFIYCLSHIGITGTRTALEADLEGFIRKARTLTAKPLAVGFGISRPEHVKTLRKFADGVIVGSAVMNLVIKKAGSRDMLGAVGAFAESLK